ncbi:MAG TPA: hypothetical protein VHT75_16710 [Acidimicrobiales bacterium]|jgi:hypothetical protein|nr:hypothetical protein [Acidimicrobiales bacterium]
MDEKETVSQDQAKLDHLEEEIKEARHHLDEETKSEEHHEYLFEDDQEESEVPGNNNPPA